MSSKNRNNKNRNTDRIVSAHIRKLHLNSPPCWFKVPSKNGDPPVYNEDAIFQRKIRIIASSATATPVNINAKGCADAAGLTSTAFNKVVIVEAHFYSSSNDAGLRVATFMPNEVGSAFKNDKIFTDQGVSGQARSHVKVRLNPKDNRPIPTTSTDSVFLVTGVDGATGAVVGAALVIDVLCQFYSSVAVLRIDKEIPLTWEESDLSNPQVNTEGATCSCFYKHKKCLYESPIKDH